MDVKKLKLKHFNYLKADYIETNLVSMNLLNRIQNERVLSQLVEGYINKYVRTLIIIMTQFTVLTIFSFLFQ